MGLAALCRIAPFLRGLAVLAFAIALWQGIVWGTGVPHFILPGPERVWRALISSRTIILDNAWITFAQILTGLVSGRHARRCHGAATRHVAAGAAGDCARSSSSRRRSRSSPWRRS